MPEPRRPWALRTAFALVRVASLVVPRHRREGFREEWTTELVCAWEIQTRRGKPSTGRLVSHAMGSVRDAIWLARNEWSWDMLSQDVRYALRSLAKQPGFVLSAVATLALAIGSTTAIFSVVDRVLLQPLPYQEPSQLVMLWETFPERDRFRNVVSPANFLAWRENTTRFEDIAAISTSPVNLTGLDEPMEVSAFRVSPSFFKLLRVAPFMGRVFSDDEEAPDRSKVVLLSYGFWRGTLGGDPGTLGQTLSLGGVLHEIVGVLPERFDASSFSSMQLGGEPQLFLPQAFPPEAREHSGRYLSVLGRMSRGSGLDTAAEEMDRISGRLETDFPERNLGWGSNVVPLHEQQVGDVRVALLVLFAAVSLVLLIACVNIANLSLARAIHRRREVAIRTSLGAAGSRIVRQLLTESTLISVVGGTLGIGLAAVATPALVSALPDSVALPRRGEISMDGLALAFGLALSFGCGIVFGVLPAMTAASTDLNDSLRDGAGRGTVGSSRKFRALVIAQTALALVLLTGAGLLMRSFFLVNQVDPGLRGQGVLTARLILPRTRYGSATARTRFYDDLIEALNESPGVSRAGAIQWLPMSGLRSATSFYRADQPEPAPDEKPVTDVRIVSSSYFRTMGIPLLSGRDFDARDRTDTPRVLLVNKALAQQFFPDESPIGKPLSVSWDDDDPTEIIGIVGDVRHSGLEDEPRPAVYFAYPQMDQGFMHVVLHTDGDPEAMVTPLKQAVGRLDAEQPLASIRSFSDVTSASVATRRFQVIVISVFAGAAMLLAGLGIYSVMAYSVGQRRQEMGLRMALGARAADVRRLIVYQALGLSLTGSLVGLAMSFALSRWLESLLFEVGPTDPLTLGSVSLVLLAVAALGSYWPAQRATRVDPLETLRSE